MKEPEHTEAIDFDLPGADQEINERIKNDPDFRREFVDHWHLVAALDETLGDQENPPAPVPIPWYAKAKILLPAAAALVAISLLAWQLLQPTPSSPAPFIALVTAADEAQWTQGDQLQDVGAALRPGLLDLTSGELQIQFDAGAVVSLTAPTKLELIDENRARLLEGKLAAHVPPEAIGFTVEGPEVDVIDLGTEFAFSVSPDGESQVHVFDGEVDAVPTKSDSNPVRLNANQTGRYHAEKGDIQNVAFNAKNFASPPSRKHSQVYVSGRVRRLFRAPQSVKAGRFQHDYILLFQEQKKLTIDEALPVTLTKPGRHFMIHEVMNSEEILTKPGKVDVWFLHLDSASESTVKANGTIRFNKPILGIIASKKHLKNTDESLGSPNTNYFTHRDRTLEGDRCTLSADRKTLSLNWGVARQGVDQIRVIVAAE